MTISQASQLPDSNLRTSPSTKWVAAATSFCTINMNLDQLEMIAYSSTTWVWYSIDLLLIELPLLGYYADCLLYNAALD